MNGSFFAVLDAAAGNAAECGADSIVVEVSSDGSEVGCFVSDNREDFDNALDASVGESVIAAGGEWEYLANPEFGGSLKFTAKLLPGETMAANLPQTLWDIAAKVFDGSYGEKTVMFGRTSPKGAYTVLLEDFVNEGKDGFISKIKELEATL